PAQVRPRPSPSPTPGREATPTASRPSPSSPAPAPRSATFSSAGGRVTVSCRGTVATLGSIVPENGWRVHEEHIEHGHLDVTFSAGESEVKVEVSCVGGVPTQRSS
ncbi:MAG: hypothetical protein M3Y71_15530, partial [Actinomycetota bacterium]|nr:hypothetical protein [Actinomycetota bacterium]